MRTLATVSAFFGALALASVTPRLASAAWPHSPGINLPVCTAGYDQQLPTIVSDGAGGAIVTWADLRSGTNNDIYAQHVLASGAVDPAWPANGRALCTAANEQIFPAIVSDGSGGAIITWQDLRNAIDVNIYAQHVLSTGAVDGAWPADGRALCTAANFQTFPTIVSDGAGGAIVTWQDLRGGATYDIYAQRVLSTGAVDGAWPVDGRALCTAANNQSGPTIVADGAGGGIVTWQDLRGGATLDIYAQHVLSTGAVDGAWPVDGRALCTAANDQRSPTIVADDAGGAIVTWYDFRSGTNNDIYAHHVLASGAVDGGWPVDGRALCTAANGQSYPTIVSDGAGGAIVTWFDSRVASIDIYAQHVLSSGAVDPAWPVDGRALCTAANSQYNPTIVADGAGGAIVAWYDYRNSTINSDIYAQHVLASGAVDGAWPVDGRALCTAAGNQQNPIIAADGAGGAIVTWPDSRSGTADIYAQRVARFGYLGTPEAEIIGVRDVPNDNGGKVKLSWYASWLDSESDPNLSAYEIYRSAAPNLMASALASGARLLATPADTPEPGQRTFLTTALGTSVYAWEYLTTQNALHYIPAYSYLAPTASDSGGAYNPRTVFMIVARNTSGSMYWLSRPDSGYSADNVPPIMPAPFLGNYAAGITHLHWNPNAESDLAGYRLYRGTSGSFTPGPANLVSDQPDTGYVDTGSAGGYYKLSAVDIHGNQSGYALLTPAQITGVFIVPTPGLALDDPHPNPARDDVTVGFALPRAARATLAVFDALGRRTRVLADGVIPAGQHAIHWDFRDETGRPVGNGIYLVRLAVDGRTLTRRLAAIR